MNTYLSHISALYFWRQRATEDFSTLPRSRKQTLTDCCTSAKEQDDLYPSSLYFGPGPKHVIVPGAEFRVNRREFHYHVYSQKLPTGSLVELDTRTYVSSPELCFVQMAPALSVPGLVQLGLELCGTYRLQMGTDAESGHIALTTPARLKIFVAKCGNIKGHKKAARALRWILAGSASPRETQVYVRLCISNKLAGYGFPFPRPNGEMRLNQRQQILAERSTSYGDLYWADKDVDVEYFGADYHTGKDRMNSDAKRNNALTSRNTNVYTITEDIYGNAEKFDAIAHEIAHALDFKINTRSYDLAYRNQELARELDEQEKLTHPEQEEDQDPGQNTEQSPDEENWQDTFNW